MSRRNSSNGSRALKRARRTKQVALGTAAATLYFGMPATPAEAVIVHNTNGFFVGPGQSVEWDIDGNSASEWQLRRLHRSEAVFSTITTPTYSNTTYYLIGFQDYHSGIVDGAGRLGNGLVRFSSDFGPVVNLPQSVSVGPTLAPGYSFGNAGSSAWLSYASSGPNGSASTFPDALNFTPGQPGYVGFQFLDAPGGDNHYGWARITLDPHVGITVHEWAYQDVADVPINVGQTAIPEPGTLAMSGLALLACGAAGVRRWRKERLAKAEAQVAEQ